jgi:hypothetical protein
MLKIITKDEKYVIIEKNDMKISEYLFNKNYHEVNVDIEYCILIPLIKYCQHYSNNIEYMPINMLTENITFVNNSTTWERKFFDNYINKETDKENINSLIEYTIASKKLKISRLYELLCLRLLEYLKDFDIYEIIRKLKTSANEICNKKENYE